MKGRVKAYEGERTAMTIASNDNDQPDDGQDVPVELDPALVRELEQADRQLLRSRVLLTLSLGTFLAVVVSVLGRACWPQ